MKCFSVQKRIRKAPNSVGEDPATLAELLKKSGFVCMTQRESKKINKEYNSE